MVKLWLLVIVVLVSSCVWVGFKVVVEIIFGNFMIELN